MFDCAAPTHRFTEIASTGGQAADHSPRAGINPQVTVE